MRIFVSCGSFSSIVNVSVVIDVSTVVSLTIESDFFVFLFKVGLSVFGIDDLLNVLVVEIFLVRSTVELDDIVFASGMTIPSLQSAVNKSNAY